jgi:hypothetical protein
MIQAIIFDCFGVLTTEGFGVFRDKYFEGAPKKREQANALMDELNTGRLSYDGFIDGLVNLSGTSRAACYLMRAITGLKNFSAKKILSFLMTLFCPMK